MSESIRGQRGLATALGVSAKTANKYVRDSRWKFGKGPWTPKDIDSAKEWRRKWYPTESEIEAAADKGPGDDLAAAKHKVMVQRGVKLELENQLTLKGYVKREDVEEQNIARIQAVRSELRNIRILAIRLEGKTLPEREQVLEGWARAACEKFARGEA